MASFGELQATSASPLGIITEASPLNFPEGASLDEKNFTIERTGKRQRRLGIDFSNEGTNLPFSCDASAELTVLQWTDAGENRDKDYVLIQDHDNMYVHDATDPDMPVVKIINTEGGGLFPTSPFQGRRVSGATLNGSFVFVFGSGSIFFDDDPEAGGHHSQAMEVRDLWGIDDTVSETALRPSTLSDAHAYNLANQGWYVEAAEFMRTGDGPDLYPSNADVYAFGTGTDDIFREEIYHNVPFGNTPSPKGSSIINPFAPEQGRFSGIFHHRFADNVNSALYADRTLQGVTLVTEHGGRLFYAGAGSPTTRVNDTYPDFSNYVFFSQIYETRDDVFKCRQEADPTDPDGSIVATDGGFVAIPSAGRILKMVSTGKSILVFGTGGVWELTSTDSFFTPEEYQVRKVTSLGALNSKSIVEAADNVLYWSDYGIHLISLSDVEQYYVAQNFIADTIQTLYDDIPATSKTTATGLFDSIGKKIRWLYSSTGGVIKDRELVFDVVLKAWYRNEIAATIAGQGVVDYVPLPDSLQSQINNQVLAGADTVIAGTDNVVTEGVQFDSNDRNFRYLVYKPQDTSYGFAEFKDADFKDWAETDADAFLITGYNIGEQASRRKNAGYLTVHLERTETQLDIVGGEVQVTGESSCTVQAQWDWTDNSVAGKFGTPFEAYRHTRAWFPTFVNNTATFDNGYPVVTTKNRLRGSGRALSLKFSTSPDKDCRILGWNLQLQQNDKV